MMSEVAKKEVNGMKDDWRELKDNDMDGRTKERAGDKASPSLYRRTRYKSEGRVRNKMDENYNPRDYNFSLFDMYVMRATTVTSLIGSSK